MNARKASTTVKRLPRKRTKPATVKADTGKTWTIMVYMAGDNDLDPEGVKDLKEIKKIGSTEKVNVVAQFDRAKGHVARRYYLRKGGDVIADAVASIGGVNTGDPKALLDFIQWGIKTYPAKHYLLVLWNHGQGWDDTDIYADERFRGLRRLATGPIRHALFRTPVRQALAKARSDTTARAILLDDDAKDFLDNLEMKKVLASTAKLLKRKLDILGMDACLMSMAEVGYQMRDSAAYTVGSEQTEPGEGWPYHTILGALAKKPDMTPRDVSAMIVDKYLASYPASTEGGVTYSACDLAKSKDLATAVTALAKALKTSLNNPAGRQRIMVARNQVQSFYVNDNIDLVDYCKLLIKAGPEPTVAKACQQVVDAVSTKYIIAQGYKGSPMKDSNGLAIYFPIQSVSPLYPGLDFSKKTGWDGFLAAFIKAIRKR